MSYPMPLQKTTPEKTVRSERTKNLGLLGAPWLNDDSVTTTYSVCRCPRNCVTRAWGDPHVYTDIEREHAPCKYTCLRVCWHAVQDQYTVLVRLPRAARACRGSQEARRQPPFTHPCTRQVRNKYPKPEAARQRVEKEVML